MTDTLAPKKLVNSEKIIKSAIMKKQLVTLLFICFVTLGYTQSQNKKLNAIGIAIPIIWSNAAATYYSLGSPKYVTGKAISYGINFNHSRTIHKDIFGVAGIGYFKQVFGIKRPFNFIAPDATRPLVFTQWYLYHSLHLQVGLGYRLPLHKGFSINGTAVYHHFISFGQKYEQTYTPNYSQVGNKLMTTGHIIGLHIEPEVQLSKKTSIAMGLLLPVSIQWKDDKIFMFDDALRIARNKSSIGTTISYKYHF
jgi:hypothetical protein